MLCIYSFSISSKRLGMKFPCSQIYEAFVPDLGSKKRRPKRVSFMVLLVVILGLHFLTLGAII